MVLGTVPFVGVGTQMLRVCVCVGGWCARKY